MQLTADEVAALALYVGLSNEAAAIATAIGWGPGVESSGNTEAIGDTTTISGILAPSVGVWQIRTLDGRILAAHARGEIDKPTREAFIHKLKDPIYNARQMASISSQGRSFSPWSGYTSGKYAQYMDEARIAVGKVKASNRPLKETVEAIAKGSGAGYPAPGTPIGKPGEPTNESLLDKAFAWLGAGVARGALIVGGGTLLIVMLLVFLMPAVNKVAEVVT